MKSENEHTIDGKLNIIGVVCVGKYSCISDVHKSTLFCEICTVIEETVYFSRKNQNNEMKKIK
jgi:hypothetical protein